MTNPSKLGLTFPSTIEVTWYVGFTRGEESDIKWWRKWLHPEFQHVYAYAPALNNTATLIYTNTGGTVIYSLDQGEVLGAGYDNIHQHLAQLLEPTAVLPVTGVVDGTKLSKRWSPLTCVELVKSLLGIDKLIYTPKKLHDYLLENHVDKNLMGDLLRNI